MTFTHIQLRRDTAANWALNNPILLLGETGWETDTLKAKLGDGVTTWNSLVYITGLALPANLASSAIGQGDALITVFQPLVGSVVRNQGSKNSDTVSVQDFGATGNGVTDDTAAIQLAITGTYGKRLIFPAGTYLLSGLITVAGTIVIDAMAATFNQTSSVGVFQITASNVTILGGTYNGPQYAANHANETAIYAVGASAAAPVTNFLVQDATFNGWGQSAVQMKYVTGFLVMGCNISNIYYAGIAGISAIRGMITQNVINNVVGTPNAYGIYLSRQVADSTVTDPRSSDVAVIANTISNVPNWEGLDTHGGQRIAFVGNTLYGCKYGISLVAALGVTTGVSQSPLDCVVANNTLDSGVTNGTTYGGITVNGDAHTVGSSYTQAKNIVISGNTIRGYGTDGTNTSGGLIARDTNSLTVTGNDILNSSPCGIILIHDNYDFNLNGNTITDTWSNGAGGLTAAYSIRFDDQYNLGYMGANSTNTDTMVATYVNTIGIQCPNTFNNAFQLGPFRCESATPIVDPAGTCTMATPAPARNLAKTVVSNGSSTAYTYPLGSSYVYLTATSATSLATTLPATMASMDGKIIELVSLQAVATATWVANGTGGSTIVGGPSAIVSNVPIRFIFHFATNTWYPY